MDIELQHHLNLSLPHVTRWA